MAKRRQHKLNSEKLIVQHLQFEVIEDDIEPPPPDFLSTFKTMQDWLLDICENDKPGKPIANYNFGLFESPNDYILYLVGVNTYDEAKNRSINRVEFKPTNMYFRLPKIYWEDKNRDQLLDELILQLQNFINTEHFKSSFIARAKAIVFEPKGHIIWSGR